MVFFKITALHSCQLELRPKPNNLCIKNVALQQCKKMKFFASASQEFLQKISKHLLSRTLFVDCLRYKERITEKES